MKPPSSATKWRPANVKWKRRSNVSASRAARKISAVTLAERFGGVLLSEIYDDVTIDDAPYSALYGPSRHAIVVPDLSLVREMLEGLEDCPEDLYLIEGIRSRSMTACSPSKSRTKRWW